MLFTDASLIGIDPTAGHTPFVYAALDADLKMLALGEGEMDEVLAFVAGQSKAVVAVCAPQRPNIGLMNDAEVRDNLSPSPRPGRWLDFRLAEYHLRQHNISIPRTSSIERDCPLWMQMGFTLYRRLVGLGYRPYPAGEFTHQYLEVYPHASYTVLLGSLPFPKRTLEGRIQRQLALYEKRINVEDPMRFFEEITRHRLLNGILPEDILYTAEELDALVASYSAWMAAHTPDQISLSGDPDEGQIVLPANLLKNKYESP